MAYISNIIRCSSGFQRNAFTGCNLQLPGSGHSFKIAACNLQEGTSMHPNTKVNIKTAIFLGILVAAFYFFLR
jgi:hypothetical protein